ncbi:acetyltransferase [Loigolactobacillus backii]|uniref:acyltransferase family protein n=1 Tax=Loigolactobacillus backii TaxID=375175 RepID=UPI000C1C8827|nr:acyltransferase family protein [Loigolactobacillus backii]PIO83612.1 acetyltransferase [Loigolactobacillus backii]
MEHKKRLANSRYITGLSGLRTLAVIGVILYHLIPFTVPGGYLGVVIFLVLTGYLITDLLIQEWEQNGKIDLLDFYRRRITRLYPALVAMLFSTAAYITLFQRQLLNNLRGIMVSNLGYFYNWWQITHGQSYFERFANNESPFTHLWTLSIEGQFYLIWPFIIVGLVLFVKKRRKIAGWLFGLSLLSAGLMAFLFVPGHDPSRVYYGTDTRFFAILIGAALAIIWPSTHLKAKVARAQRLLLDGIGIVTSILVIILFFTLPAQSTFLYRGGMYLFTIIIALLTAVIVNPAADLNRFYTNRIFTWVGQRSYGIYLYQFPVMIFYENQVKDIANSPVLHGVIQLVLILLISELSYRLIERPFSHFKYRHFFSFTREFFRRRSIYGRRRLLIIPAIAILGVGMTGFAVAPSGAAKTSNQLTKNIKHNEIANSKKRSSLLAEAQKAKSGSSSDSTQSSTESAKSIDAKLAANLTQKQVSQAQDLNVTAVGDSVMLDGGDTLQQIFPKMLLDASVGRQADTAVGILQSYAAKGVLGNVVLIGLGTNGPFTDQQVDQIMRTCGAKRQVYWINVRVPTRSWQNSVNRSLTAASGRWPNLKIIDWYKESNQHSDWFYADQVHPNVAGKEHYANFVARSIMQSNGQH